MAEKLAPDGHSEDAIGRRHMPLHGSDPVWHWPATTAAVLSSRSSRARIHKVSEQHSQKESVSSAGQRKYAPFSLRMHDLSSDMPKVLAY